MPKLRDLSKEEKLYSIEIQTYIIDYLKGEFKIKHLSKRYLETVESNSNLNAEQLIFAPKKYDTAWWIKTNRKGAPRFRNKNSSYALELERKGSEFEVFRKKNINIVKIGRNGKLKVVNSKDVAISKLPEKYLDRVKVYPHNHKKYMTNAITYAIMKFTQKHKKEIEGVKLCIKL